MEVTELRNIGIAMKKKLRAVGINSAEELLQVGSREAFVRLKASYPQVCLVHLYSLQGAIDNLAFNQLPQNVKLELKEFCDALK